MRKIIVTEFISLDGVIEDPGGAESFEHGGWTRNYWDDAIGKFKFDELFASDAQLLGRVTYQGFAAAWPSQSDEAGFADRMNNMPKYVVSTTLANPQWNNSHVIKAHVAQEIANLKQQPGASILVAGSGTLIQTLIQHDLVDEYHLLVYPVVLGSGKRLFHSDTRTDLKLVESQTFSSGVVLLVYQTERKA
jgi:dihydrofolate reductase